MSKDNALNGAKARIVTLESELAKANNTILSQRTALAGLRRDAILHAEENKARDEAVALVVGDYDRDLMQAETELSQVQSKLVALSEKHESYCKHVCQAAIITLGTLFLSITMWSIL